MLFVAGVSHGLDAGLISLFTGFDSPARNSPNCWFKSNHHASADVQVTGPLGGRPDSVVHSVAAFYLGDGYWFKLYQSYSSCESSKC